MIELQMKSGREKSLERRHPWIFSGAILGADGEPANGSAPTSSRRCAASATGA